MKSLHKVLNVIDAVAKAGSVGVRELSSMIGFPPATTHRIVSTLVERHYFKQDPITKKYALSVKFLELGSKVQDQFHFAGIARPHLERLMYETKESVNLAIKEGDEMVYLDHVKSDYAMLQLFTRVGARVPLYCTGVGKMFLSQMGEAEIAGYLNRTPRTPFTRNTLIERNAILKEMARIRAKGYGVDNEEMEEGVRCVAALVFDHKGQPAASVSVSGAGMRITPERIEELARSVRACTVNISRDLGFVSPA